ncbi:MAG: hypothetical protein HYW86_00005, partial [Candidatus Roizmanbacteria bacterium]
STGRMWYLGSTGGSDKKIYLYNHLADDLLLGTNGATNVTIQNGGNVGIGTTSPGAQLQVTSGAAGTTGLIIRGAASQTGNFLGFQRSNGDSYLTSEPNSGTDYRMKTKIYNTVGANADYAVLAWSYLVTGAFSIGTYADGAGTAQPLVLGVGAQAMRIASGNNIGIGAEFSTDNVPGEALTIRDSGRNFAINMNKIYSDLTATASSGGSLTANTYYFVVVAVDGAGGTTAKNTERSATVDGATTDRVALSWNAVQGAVSYRIYKGTAAGEEDRYQTSTTNSYNYDSDTGATLGTPPVTTTAYVAKIANNGNNSWFNGGNVGIGTANPLGSLHVGTTSFFVATNGNVGIGTTNPSQKLEVAYNGGSSGDFVRITAASSIVNKAEIRGYSSGGTVTAPTITATDDELVNLAGYGYDTTGASDYKFGGAIDINRDSGVGNSARIPGYIRFRTSQSNDSTIYERMRITSTGNVGIGTTNPTVPLHIRSSVAEVRVDDGGGDVGALQISSGNVRMGTISGHPLWLMTNSTSRGSLSANGGFAWGNTFASYDPGSTNMIVQGNVGIGISSPGQQKLEVAGNIQIAASGTLTAGANDLNLGAASSTETKTLQMFYRTWRGPDDLALYTGSTAGDFRVYTKNSGGTDTERLWITDGDTSNIIFSNGNVGIGTTSPFGMLQVGSTSSPYAPAFFVSIGSNVGIGTTGPDAKLRVSGSLIVGDLANGSRQAFEVNKDNGTVSIGSASQDGELSIRNTAGNRNTYFESVETETSWINVLGSGKLGVGTTAPSSKLQVAGNVSIGYAGSNSPAPSNSLAVSGSIGIGTTSPNTATRSYTLNVQGDMIAQTFYDLNDERYVIDPAGTSYINDLTIWGNNTIKGLPTGSTGTNYSPLVLIGSGSTATTSVCIDTGGGNCDGKLDAGTIDPPYTINGKKYATYLSSMIGIKEETTGAIQTSQYITDTGYQYVVDFNDLVEGSDLWLFSKTTNLKKNLDKLVALLTPSDNTRTWYKIDKENLRLTIFSSRPTTISYRLTAPRFDHEIWTNSREDGGSGFIIDDPDVVSNLALNNDGNVSSVSYTIEKSSTSDIRSSNIENLTSNIYSLKDSFGNLITEAAAYSKATIANLTAGIITAEEVRSSSFVVRSMEAITSNIENLTSKILSATDATIARLIVQEKIISPVVETKDLTVTETANLNEIKPVDKDITINLDSSGSWVMGDGSNQNPELTTQNPQPSDSGPLAKLIIKGLEGKTAASIDAAGNATFSGTLTAEEVRSSSFVVRSMEAITSNIENLKSKEATISGTLTAKEVKAENIDNLESNVQNLSSTIEDRTSNIDQMSNDINDIQATLAKIKSEPLPDAQYYQNINNSSELWVMSDGSSATESAQINSELITQNPQPITDLTVTGSSNLYDATITNTAVIGSLFMKDNSILALSSELKLSSLSIINLFDGAVVIAKDGTITTKGTLVAEGGIKTNEIKPINEGEDVSVILKTKSEGSLANASNAETSSEILRSAQNDNAKFQIQNELGENVASIDASGSAKFNSLSLNKYMEATSSAAIIAAPDNFDKNGLYAPAIETTVETAGVGIVPQNQTEVVIYNNTIKEDSLIYLTPTSNIENRTSASLTITKKQSCPSQESKIEDLTSKISCKPYFKVAIPSPTVAPVNFNWLIIN